MVGYFSRHPQVTFRLLYYGARFGFPVGAFIGAVNGGGPILGLSGIAWLFVGNWPSYLYAEFVGAFLIACLPCPRCGLEYEAVAIWSSGGYTDHAERHFLRFRSPIDGSRVGSMDCPECGSTLLIR